MCITQFWVYIYPPKFNWINKLGLIDLGIFSVFYSARSLTLRHSHVSVRLRVFAEFHNLSYNHSFFCVSPLFFVWIIAMSLRSSFPFVSFTIPTFQVRVNLTFSTEFKLHSNRMKTKKRNIENQRKISERCQCTCVCVCGDISALTNQNLIKCTHAHILHIHAAQFVWIDSDKDAAFGIRCFVFLVQLWLFEILVKTNKEFYFKRKEVKIRRKSRIWKKDKSKTKKKERTQK